MKLFTGKRLQQPHRPPPWPLVLAGLLLLGPGLFSARGQSLSLTLRSAPLSEAFRQVEARTPVRFVYAREDLSTARPVSLTVAAAPLDSVLRLLFRHQPLTYSWVDSFIIVRKSRRAAPLPPVVRLRGRVVDEEGTGIAGASLRVVGSGAGTVADSSGAFLLYAPGKARLLASAVGYEPAEGALPDGGTLTLRRVTPVLDETVVTGYGRTTRRKATGSIAKVHGRQFTAIPATVSPMGALQGRVPGLYLRPTSGLPDAPLTARIRGQHSLQSGSSPLFLVDGVPMLLEGLPLSERSALTALAPLHPLWSTEIESIEVLKDADATAIYGSRGAGGVVLVTTRQPQEPRSGLELSLRHGWSWAGRTVDYLSTPRYLALRREAFRNDAAAPTPLNAPDLTVWDTARDQRWKKVLIGGTAPSLGAQARLRGGTHTTSWGAGGAYMREGTVYPGAFFTERTALGVQGSHKSRGGRLRLAGSASWNSARYRLPAQDLTAFAALPPNMYDPYDEQGRLRWEEGGTRAGNPLSAVHQPFTASLQLLSGSARLLYLPHPDVELAVLWGGHRLQFSEALRYPLAAQDPARQGRGSVTNGHKKGATSVWEPSARYRFTFRGRTRGTLLTGATLQAAGSQGELVTAGGYTDDALLGALAYAPSISARSEASRYRYSGLYSRLTGEHREKYLLQGTVRRDGSSRFGPGRRFALFGAVAAGWIFSREGWVRRAVPRLRYGKLRTSFGSTGNDRIGDNAFREEWRLLPYPYAGDVAWKADRLFNPAFGWEVTRKWEAALELGIVQERLLITVTRYRHRSGNLILRTPLPAQTGFTTLLSNYPALVDNRGWEGEVSLRSPARRPLTWSVTGQLTVPRNRLYAFPGLEGSSYAAAYAVGRPLDNFRGFVYQGIDGASGLYRFGDTNGDGTVDKEDQGYTGTRDPLFYGSVQGSLAWKGWTLSALLYVVRQQGLHPVYSSGVAPGDLVNMPRGVEDRWPSRTGSPAYQRATQDVLGEAYYPTTAMLAHSSAALTDASFARLNHLHLSYRVRNGAGKRGLRAWQWFFSAQNALTLARYEGDPDVQSTTTLPLLRTVETGFTLTF